MKKPFLKSISGGMASKDMASRPVPKGPETQAADKLKSIGFGGKKKK